MILPKKIQLTEEIKQDSEKVQVILKSAVNHIKKCQKSKNHFEAFLFTWALIENITLPSLMRTVWHKLSYRIPIKSFPNINRMNTSQLITSYYFLTQDYELYSALTKGNKKRNEIIHNVYGKNLLESNSLAEKSTQFAARKILVPILERLSGKKIIPVLTLYPTGWNEALTKAKKIILGH